MNRIYRLVFNRALGVMQVASELVRSVGNAVSGDEGRQAAALRPVSFALWLALGWVAFVAPGGAQQAPPGRIVADPNAPGNQRPTVLTAPNGVPLVNIQTPSAAGVSRNTYSQFDVNAEGAILNNSRSNTQTQLGGWVQGNPWLATGTAKVILNEVHSSNPSALNGYIEIAGDRAQVVIANPAGISVNGGGFLNASRATLTTGTPILGADGSLDGYRVEGGAIRIDGAGLDATKTDYTDLITRSLQLNGGLWANQLQATLGSNVVSADHAQVSAIAPTGAAPTFALDSSALGGMYANKISLVGTEHGVGVRNAGAIGAQAGDLVVTVDGRLVNTGQIQAQNNAAINAAGGVANAGVLGAGLELKLATTADVDNSGGTLNARRLDVSAASLTNRGGSIEQTGLQALQLDAGTLSNGDGGRIGLAELTSGGGGGGTGTGGTGGGGTGGTTTPTDPNAPSVPTPPIVPLADGALRIAGTLNNDAGAILAGGGIGLRTDRGLDNDGGNLGLASLTVSQGDIRNAGGTLAVQGAAQLNVNTIDNDAGQFSIGGPLSLSAQSFSNRSGAFLHGGTDATAWQIAGVLDNTSGRLATNATAFQLNADTLVDEQGKIEHAGTGGMTLAVGTLNGAGGQISSGSALTVGAGSVDHRNATLTANGLNVAAQQFDNRGGTIQSGSDAMFAIAGTLENSGGTLGSVGDTHIAAETFANIGGSVQSAGAGTLDIRATTLKGATGTIAGNGALTIASQTTDLRGGTSFGQTVDIATGTLVTAGGLLQSAGTLNLDATQSIDNAAGRIASSGDTAITTALLDNQAGTIQHAGTGALDIAATTLNGAGGTLGSNGALTITGTQTDLSGGTASAQSIAITTDTLSTASGSLQSAGTLDLTVRHSLDNTAGAMASVGALTVQGGEVINTDGSLATASALNLTVSDLTNARGRIESGASTNLQVAGGVGNQGGRILAQDALHLSSDSLDNTGGLIGAIDGALDLTVVNGLTNVGGQLQSGTDLTLHANGLDNMSGSLLGNMVTVDAGTGVLDNDAGRIAGQAVVIGSGALSNDAGLIQATTSLAIDTHGQILTNANSGTANGISSGGSLTIASGDLNNGTGVIIGAGSTSVQSAAINNAGGQIGSQGMLTLTGTGLTNSGGQVQAQGDAHLDVGAGSIDNTAGLLASAANLTIDTASLINRDTQGANQGVLGANTTVSATTIDNTRGLLTAQQTLTVTGSGALNNTAGELSAGTTLDLHDAVATRAIDNTTGRIVAGDQLNLQAKSLTGNGTVQSGNNASLDLVDRFDNTGSVQANGDLSLATQGDLTNAGQIMAGNDLSVHAHAIDNAATGEITATNGGARLTADTTLTNRGLIDSVATRIDATQIDNLGTGRIYGDHVSLGAGTINNLEEAIGGVTRSGTIAARERLDIGADTLNNRREALLYSGGDAAIGGALDADGFATGTATAVNNTSAVIDAAGTLAIDAAAIHNVRENVSITTQATVDETVTMQLASWQQNGPNSSGPLNQSNNYRAFQVLYVNPADILEYSTYIAPDGTQYGKAVVRLTPQTSSYYLAYGSSYSATGERWRLDETADTVTLYVTGRQDNQANPDQGGSDDPFRELTQGQADTGHPVSYQTDNVSYSSAYGTCTTDCVQLWMPWEMTDPDHTIFARINDPNSAGHNEQQRIAHHTATEDVLAPGAGADAVIRSGGDMFLRVDDLTNQYGQIAAGGNLAIISQNGGTPVVANVGQTLYRTHNFNNTSVAYNGTHTNWTNPSISEQIGQIGGTIVSNGTLVVDTGVLSSLNLGRNAPNVVDPSVLVNLNTGTTRTGGSANGISVDTGTGVVSVTADPTAQATTSAAAGPATIRTLPANFALPTSSLFQLTANGGSYLVETDPRFADYRNWLGSNYLLGLLGVDPTRMHKRLGDGYYEQRLVRDQVAQLTGRRFLDGYASDEEQFRTLMNAGALFAQQYGLRPGIALSAAQMAQLTSDIVWLVEQEATLPDGTRTTVLVPQVYVRLQPGDLHANGALLAGTDVHMNLRGGLVNTGDIAGRQLVSINADHIDNLAGGAISGQRVGLQATHDINVIGAAVTASDALSVKAGGNVTVASTTATQSGSGPYSWSQTTVDRVAGLYVTNPDGLGVLNVSAGGDVTLQAAQIRNAGTDGVTRIAAGGNLNLGTVTTAQSQNYDYDAKNYRHSASTTEVGTTISSANHIQLIAGNDINTAGATVSSEQGQIALVAGHDVNLLESRNTSSVSGSETHKKSNLLSSTKTEKTWQIDSNTATGTTLSGDSVLIKADHDVTTRGADVVATHDVDVVAGNNINIGTATETYNQKYTSKTSKSGLVDLSATSVTVGNRQIGNETTIQETVQKGSTVGSLEGNVHLTAGNHYTQTGSTVSAPEGDVDILAKSVDIQSAQNTTVTKTVDTFKQKGITAAFSSPVTDSLQSAYGASRDVGQSKDARVNAMAAANAGYSAYQAGQAMQAPGGGANNGSGQKGGNLSVSITYGQQQSKATSTTTEVANQASTVYGNRVNITATGAGQDSNINVIGSDIGSRAGTTLRADNAINLLSAQDTVDYASKNSSQGWNAGVAISFGNGNGAAFGFTGGGNAGKGNADMSRVTQRNTTVGSDGTTTLISGGATTIRGGQVTGNQVVVDVGDLKIESPQDTETYKSAQKDASAQVTVGYGFSASGSYSQSNVKSDYASVGQQSGILAGDGGYQVNVRDNTDLKGGIITSTQAAEEAGRNSLVTGTLTSSDIDNHANYQASGISLGGGMSISSNNGQQSTGVNKALGFGKDSDKQSSTTHSGISTGNITITDGAGQAATGKSADQIKAEVTTTTTTDQVAAGSGALVNKFDASRVEKEVSLQMRVTQEFDRNRQEAKQELYAYAQAKQDQAREIRMANNGVETDESRKLDEEAAGIKKTAMWMDIAAMGIYAGPDASNLITGEALTQIDLVRRAATAQSKIVLQKCEASAQNCTQREVDLKDVVLTKDGKIYVFNNGIMNTEEYALASGAKQNMDDRNAAGVYHIINPHTGNPVAEVLYAGYDKLNAMIGTMLPLTSAEKTNIDFVYKAQELGGVINSVNHSRGGLTEANTMQYLDRKNEHGLPIDGVLYNGAAANAQKGANTLQDISDIGKMYQSTNAADKVGRIIGGNPATGSGRDNTMKVHSSYTGGVPKPGSIQKVGDADPVDLRKLTDNSWGDGKYSAPREVAPNRPKKPQPKPGN